MTTVDIQATTLHGLIRDRLLADLHAPTEDVAEALLAEVKRRPELVRTLLAHEVAHVRRQLIRSAEVETFAGLTAYPVDSRPASSASIPKHESPASASPPAVLGQGITDTHLSRAEPAGAGAGQNDSDTQAARAGSVTPLILRRQFLDVTFIIRGEGTVTWGAATVEQHQSRIGQLVTHVNGVRETMLRHAQAIEAIKRAGVRCLDDLALEAHNE